MLYSVAPGRGTAVRTRPSVRVIASTKWEVNMTRKYHVASSAIFPKIVGKLTARTLDLAAAETMNRKARESGLCLQ